MNDSSLDVVCVSDHWSDHLCTGDSLPEGQCERFFFKGVLCDRYVTKRFRSIESKVVFMILVLCV